MKGELMLETRRVNRYLRTKGNQVYFYFDSHNRIGDENIELWKGSRRVLDSENVFTNSEIGEMVSLQPGVYEILQFMGDKLLFEVTVLVEPDQFSIANIYVEDENIVGFEDLIPEPMVELL
jgi:hypothetical protein